MNSERKYWSWCSKACGNTENTSSFPLHFIHDFLSTYRLTKAEPTGNSVLFITWINLVRDKVAKARDIHHFIPFPNTIRIPFSNCKHETGRTVKLFQSPLNVLQQSATTISPHKPSQATNKGWYLLQNRRYLNRCQSWRKSRISNRVD